MAIEVELITPSDKPALVAASSPGLELAARGALHELGYKVHTAATHDEFMTRYNSVQYQVVLIEETFASTTPQENASLGAIQGLPMIQRRHATFVLVSSTLQSLNSMQAFRQSVHAILNTADIGQIKRMIEQACAENATALAAYRDIQARIAQGKS